MTLKKEKEEELFLDFSHDYQQAVFGSFHIAFMTRDENYVLPKEDFDSLKMALWFYENKIKDKKKYPVFDSHSYVYKEGSDREALFQILGLPRPVFDGLDLNEDILSQLTFKDGLSNLKKECYQQRANEDDTKWYHDDFQLFCLKNGIFFLYDETIPFIENDNPVLPVFFKEDAFDKEFLTEYKTFDYERLAIDFLGIDYDSHFISIMKEMDQYPLERRIAHFINDDYDTEIASALPDPVYRKKYAKILRRMIATFINHLYDIYSYTVINNPTIKNSYLTKVKIRNTRTYYSVSSFSGDMFSFDCKKWYFSNFQKEEICNTIHRLVIEYGTDDILGIYAKSALPYYGYLSLKDKDIKTEEELLSSLPFTDEISYTEYYLGVKRYDVNYSYFFSATEHKVVFLSRYLLNQGIVYYPIKNVQMNDKNITIEILPQNRCDALTAAFDDQCYSLKTHFFYSYLIERGGIVDKKTEKMVDELDKRSSLHAGFEFYHSFKNRSLKDAIESLLSRYDMMAYLDGAIQFFSYLIAYPFYVAESELRQYCMKNDESGILQILDYSWMNEMSYEPELSYPYVLKGKMFYAFKKTPFSKPYLCECSRKALEERYAYLLSIHPVNEDDVDNVIEEYERRTDDIYKLGLPTEVVQLIKEDSYDPLSRISYKRKICHLCQKKEPSNYDSFDQHTSKFYNIYSSYLKQRCYENHIYIEPDFTIREIFPNFITKLKDGDYSSLFACDLSKIKNPLLKPYLNIDKTTILSLLASFYPQDIDQEDVMMDLEDFFDMSDEEIHQILFACDQTKYEDVLSHMYVIGHLLCIYENLKMAYISELSKEVSDDNFNEYCFNFDYNPHLVYPYVIFGSRFNAYTDDVNSGHYYFCECDKKSIRDVMNLVLKSYRNRDIDPDWLAPVVLGVTGLPFLVVLKMKDIDFDTMSVDDVIGRLEFRQSICRRCLNVSHSAYLGPFLKTEPFKEGDKAELRFVNEAFVKDGFMCLDIENHINGDFSNKSELRIDGEDTRLPFLIPLKNRLPESVYRVFNPTKEEIQNDLSDFSSRYNISQETLAYATGVILDTYNSNPKVMFELMKDALYEGSLTDKIREYFPQMSRLRKEFEEPVIQVIARYLSCLYQKLVSYYVDKEKHIGR